MKILHLITGMRKAAGTTVFCGEVCRELAGAGHEVALATSDRSSPNRYVSDPRVREISLESIPLPDTRLPFRPDIVHIHAIWAPVLHRAAKWAFRQGIPVVWSPHGMLTPWSLGNHRLKKLAAWWLYQRRDMRRAALLHATSESEAGDLRRLGFRNPVAVIPLGVRLEDAAPAPESGRMGRKPLLFVSRVQKKKGLDNLVRAWCRLPEPMRNQWKARIVGPDQEGHTAELETLCARLGVARDFDFAGPRYGADLTREYASADLFVLPTHSENFGSVVVESLAQGVPVICTKGAPWSELESHGCGWWIDIGVEPLAAALLKAMAMSGDELRRMGGRGRDWVRDAFSWEAVGRKMAEAYQSIPGIATTPS